MTPTEWDNTIARIQDDARRTPALAAHVTDWIYRNTPAIARALEATGADPATRLRDAEEILTSIVVDLGVYYPGVLDERGQIHLYDYIRDKASRGRARIQQIRRILTPIAQRPTTPRAIEDARRALRTERALPVIREIARRYSGFDTIAIARTILTTDSSTDLAEIIQRAYKGGYHARRPTAILSLPLDEAELLREIKTLLGEQQR